MIEPYNGNAAMIIDGDDDDNLGVDHPKWGFDDNRSHKPMVHDQYHTYTNHIYQPSSKKTYPNHINGCTLWLFNVAMEAMAHRNRWFTVLKNGWIFPWLCNK